MSRRRLLLLAFALVAAAPIVFAGSAAACHPVNDPIGFPFKLFKDMNRQVAGAVGDKCLPFDHSGWTGPSPTYIETVGAGACAADVNKDGKVDLYFTNGKVGNKAGAMLKNVGNADHPLAFEDITQSSGVTVVGWGTGCAFADFDNDGDPDLYVAGYGGGTLYRNQGSGTFTDVTAPAGVANDQCGVGVKRCWGTAPAWFDYDRDGDLDLVVVNYIDISESDTSSLNPDFYDGQPNTLYRNDGPDADGVWRFTEVSHPDCLEPGAPACVGIEFNADGGGRSLALATADYDADGWVDLLVANDEDAAGIYRNNRDGTFREVSGSSGLHDDRANMGLDWADVNGDGRLEAILTHFSNECPGLWQNKGADGFADKAEELGVGAPWNDDGQPPDCDDNIGGPISWGANFFDMDNDGDWDLWITNGHPNADDGTAPQDGVLFEYKDGKFNWLNDATEGDAGTGQKRMGRGAVFTDLDNDGDWDIAAANNKGTANLLRNAVRGDGSDNAPAAAKNNHWITLAFKGTTSPCEPWGATVKVTFGGRSLTRPLVSGGSYQSGNDARLHFGLGTATSASVEVQWPSGSSETYAFNGVANLDKTQTLTETLDAAPPAPTGLEPPQVSGTSADIRFHPVSVCDFARYEFHVGTTPDFTPSAATKQGESATRDAGKATLAGLPENAQLYLRVVAVDPAGQQGVSSAVAVHTADLPPPAVQVQPVTVTCPTTADVSWTRSDAADFARYEVHVGAAPGFTPAAATLRASVTQRDTTQASLSGLPDHADLYVRVVVADTGNAANASAAVAFTTPNGVPPTPMVEVPASGIGTTELTLSWPTTPPPADLASYEVHRSKTAGFEPGPQTSVASFADRVTEHKVTGLEPGTAYRFRLVVSDTGGLKATSAEVTATTQAVQVPAVQLKPPVAVGPDWAVLRWDASTAPGFQAYEVHLGGQDGFTPSSATLKRTLLGVTATEVNVTGLPPATPFHARVVVRTTQGASASNSVAFTTQAAGPGASSDGSQGGTGSSSGGLLVLRLEVAPSKDGTSATVTWETNRPSWAQVFLDAREVEGDPALNVRHEVRLTGLAPGGSYKVTIVAREPTGPEARETRSFTTPSTSGTAPTGPESVEAVSDGRGINVRWTIPAAASGVVHIRVYRTFVGGPGAEHLLAEMGPDVRALRDTPPDGVPEVRYRVATVDAFGRESGPSPQSSALAVVGAPPGPGQTSTPDSLGFQPASAGAVPPEAPVLLALGVAVVGVAAYALGRSAAAPARGPPRGGNGGGNGHGDGPGGVRAASAPTKAPARAPRTRP